MPRNSPPRRSDLPAGHDEEDPYEKEDLSTYPDWWRNNIILFRKHNMRPYRPPRFLDGEFVPEHLKSLEKQFDIDIQLRAVEPQKDPDWKVLVNGKEITTVNRRREGEGYSEYDMTSEEFHEVIQNSI